VVAVQVWLSSLDELDPAQALDVLSSGELERAERTRSALLRRRFLGRRLMARALLADATGQASGDLTLERGCERCGNQHPASPISTGSTSVWWSTSSSAGLAAVAISNSRIGLDVERDDDNRPRWQRIADRFYTGAERSAVGESRARFLEFWTLKEAYLKAIGKGLAGGLRSLDCAGLSDAPRAWRQSPAHPGWRFRSLHPASGFIGAVAVEGMPDSIEIRWWNPDAGEAS
jgi:4'-phosphopantetheinyl transferase